LQFRTFDTEYVARLRAGDAGTSEHFASYFGELIQLKLRSRMLPREAVEDISQETFARVLSALRSEGGLRQADRLGAFVNSVCNFVLLEYYRAHPRNDTIETEDDVPLSSREPDALTNLLTQDEVRAVREILTKLPERDRRLLRGVFLKERDKDEICRELGVDREYLRVLVHRAKQTFKAVYVKRFRPPRTGSEG